MSRARRTGRRGRPPVTDGALLLRRTPYGESSLIVHVLTRSSGRVELIAKGAHRPKSRFCGVLDWFDTLSLEWTPSRVPGELGTLRTGQLVQRRRGPTRDLGAYRAAQTMVELVDLATRAGAVEQGTFELLERGLDALDRGGSGGAGPAPALVLATFELRLLGVLGLEPALERCAVCGEPAPPPDGAQGRAAFSTQAGGRLCPRHAAELHAQGVRVGTLPLDVLERAAELAEGRKGSERRADPERLLDFAARFLDHHLESRPRSHAHFLAAPDRNRRGAAQAAPPRARPR